MILKILKLSFVLRFLGRDRDRTGTELEQKYNRTGRDRTGRGLEQKPEQKWNRTGTGTKKYNLLEKYFYYIS